MDWNHGPWLSVIVLPVLLSVWTWASHLIFLSLSVLLGKIKMTLTPTSPLLRWPNEMINVNTLHKLLSSRSAFPKVCSMGRRLVSSDALWEKKKKVVSWSGHLAEWCVLIPSWRVFMHSRWLLVRYCHVTNKPNIRWLKPMINVHYLIVSVDQEFETA